MQGLKLFDIVSKHVKPMSPNDSVHKSLQLMQKKQISSVTIVDENNIPIGIFTEKDAIRVAANNIDTKVNLSKVMTQDPFVVHGSLRLQDAYLILEKHRFRHLIVIDNEQKYVGIVTEGDFLRNLGLDKTKKNMLIQDIMIATPLIVEENLSIKEIALEMEKHDTDYAIIAHKNKPVGMVSERDIAHYLAKQKYIQDHQIDALDLCGIYTVKQNVILEKAITMMEQHGVHQLIVTDDEDNIVGLIDRHSVLRAIHGAYIDFLVQMVDSKIIDIEKLTKSREILAEQKQFFESIIDTIPDLIWLKDTNGIYITCNKAFEKFFGASREEIIGKSDYSFVDKELADRFRKHDLKAIKLNAPTINEEHLKFQNGNYQGEFETIKTPMKNANGDLIGVLGVSRDITDKKMQLDIFNDAQAIAHIGSWYLDLQTNELKWSDECYRIFDIPMKSDVDLNIFISHIHKNDRKKVLSAWGDALKGKTYNIEHRIVTKNEIKWVKERARFVLNDDNRPTIALGSVQDITAEKEYENELICMANTDHLTGLANRVLLNNIFKNSIELSARYNKKCALLLFDLDHFKDINDSFGHKMGDEILKKIANRLRERLRHSDVVARLCSDVESGNVQDDKQNLIARLGGDEFAVALNFLDTKEDAIMVAQDIMQIIKQPLELTPTLTVEISSSVGIAIAPDHATNPNELLQFADSALYKAKQNGRFTFEFYSQELTQTAKDKIKWKSKLQKAIENKEFVMYYQPQVDLRTGKIVGVESLVRWKKEDGNIISPDFFIPIAEQNGLIIQLGEWIFEESCRQTKKWLDEGKDIHTSINVSAHQIYYYDIVNLVKSTLTKLDLPPERIIIEITESVIMKKQKQVIQKINEIKHFGVKIAIDDFGTEYSSYNYLKEFPVDILKIDKSFIDDIPYDNKNTIITKAVVAMGKAMGYTVLAEGVETKEQKEFLIQAECDLYQGYLKSKPVKASKLDKYL